MNIDEMQPGQELDVLIATKVMGFEFPRIMGGSDLAAFHIGIPEYSIDISAAWQVVQKLRLAIGPDIDSDGWYVTKLGSKIEGSVDRSAPLAICRAALKAVQNEH